MHEETLVFIKALEANGAPPARMPMWAAEFALSCIVEENVGEMLQLLAQSKSEANLEFWSIVNNAPTEEAAWDRLRVIGGGVSESAGSKYKSAFRRSVEIVRNHVAEVVPRTNALFAAKT